MQTRSALQKQAQTWLDEADGIPPGNGPEADLWGSGSGEASIDLSAMSPAELAAYEEKKFKLRKAMGEGGVGQVEEAGPVDPEERRQKLINAMEVGAKAGCLVHMMRLGCLRTGSADVRVRTCVCCVRMLSVCVLCTLSLCIHNAHAHACPCAHMHVHVSMQLLTHG